MPQCVPISRREMESGGDGDGDEEIVTHQAVVVFHSYAYHRFQTEAQHDTENGLFTPAMPEIMACQQNPLSPSMHVGRQLAILGEDIYRRYNFRFNRFLYCMADVDLLRGDVENGGDGDGDGGFFLTPTPPLQKTRRPSTMFLDTEESVTQQAGNVYRSFACHHFQTETQHDTENGLFTPAVPEIMECQQNPLSPSMHVGRQLAILGEDINRRYEFRFNSPSKHVGRLLAILGENIYRCYKSDFKSYFSEYAVAEGPSKHVGRQLAILGENIFRCYKSDFKSYFSEYAVAEGMEPYFLISRCDMESGGDGDGDDGFFPPPTQPFQKTRRPSTMFLDTEESVTQQAEDVFRSYGYHRFQTEAQHDTENGLFTPAVPKIMECQQNPLSPSKHVGRQLAILGENIYRCYKSDFKSYFSEYAVAEGMEPYFLISRCDMESGGDGDGDDGFFPPPTQPFQKTRRPSTMFLDTESVTQQAEDVFRSYGYHRFQTEAQHDTENGLFTPAVPKIMECQQNPLSPSKHVGRQLAILGENIYRCYKSDFKSYFSEYAVAEGKSWHCHVVPGARMKSKELLQENSCISGIVRSALQPPNEICMEPFVPMSLQAENIVLAFYRQHTVGKPVHAWLDGLGATLGEDERHSSSFEEIHDEMQRPSKELLQENSCISGIVRSALQPPNEICMEPFVPMSLQAENMQHTVGKPVHAWLDGLGATLGEDERHSSSFEEIHDEMQRARKDLLPRDYWISWISSMHDCSSLVMSPARVIPCLWDLSLGPWLSGLPGGSLGRSPTLKIPTGSFMDDLNCLTKTILILTCFFFSGLNAQRVGHQEPITWTCPLAGATTIRLYQNQLEVASCITIGTEICKSLYTNLKLCVDDWNGPQGLIYSMRDQTDGFIVEVFTGRLISNRCNVTVPAEVTKPATIATSTPSTRTPWTELDNPANSKNGMKITPLVGAVVAALVVLGGVVVGMIVLKKSRGLRRAGEKAEKANKESSDSSKSSEAPLKQWIDI
ncbi:uncharacterized protein LOC144933218 isoform X4 [Lampetra fluviatilis]